jgi:hypothetical protein
MNEDKASRYQRLKRRCAVASVVWSVLLRGGLLASGFSGSLRQAAESVAARFAPAGWEPSVVVLGYVVLLSLVNEIGGLPLAFYSAYLVERRYDLSSESLGGWAADQAK